MLSQFTDFANVLKAFIGTSYISLPFAFYQSGLAVSIFKQGSYGHEKSWNLKMHFPGLEKPWILGKYG